MQDSLVSAAHEDDEGDGLPSWLPPCCHSLFASCFKAMAGAAQELEEKLEVAAHVAGVVQVTGTLGPTQMMLCKADLSDKHERWFRIDADESTIEWSKQAAEGKLVLPTKGPFQLLAVRELAGGVIEIQTSCSGTGTSGLEAKFRAGSGEIVRIKPSRTHMAGGETEYDRWLSCCEGVVAKHKGSEWKQKAEASLSTYEGVRGPHQMMVRAFYTAPLSAATGPSNCCRLAILSSSHRFRKGVRCH